jgi:thiol-disulfide isomerase/thioredoxin
MKYIFLLLLSFSVCTSLFAQKVNFKVDQNSVVKDSDGMIYPYLVWRNLLMLGDYELQPIDKQNETTDFLLVKLTEEQKNLRMEKLPKPAETTYFKTGSEFSAFKTSDINKNKINLKEEKGKIFVLNFWFINCPPCRMEIPSLNGLVESFRGNDNVRFVAIGLDNKYNIEDFLKKLPFEYNIIENGGFLADRYGVHTFPTHVVISREGKVYFHSTGLAVNTVYWLKKSINELLAQPAVTSN